jgi:hypothetical protein
MPVGAEGASLVMAAEKQRDYAATHHTTDRPDVTEARPPTGGSQTGRRGSPMTRPRWQWALGWIGLAALLAALYLYAASGLLAPGWAVALLLVIWFALLVTAIQLLRSRRPLYVLLTPVAAVLIWFGALTAGETWLGWTG